MAAKFRLVRGEDDKATPVEHGWVVGGHGGRIPGDSGARPSRLDGAGATVGGVLGTPVLTLESKTAVIKGSLDVAPVVGSAAWACGHCQGAGAALGRMPGTPVSTRESEMVAIKGSLNGAPFTGSVDGACGHCCGGAPCRVGCRGGARHTSEHDRN